MKENFNKALELVLKHEGGYVDHPQDPGGATNYGITKKVYETYLGRSCTKDEVKEMPLDAVGEIYKRKYWDKIRGDDLPSGLDWCVFDFAVNAGVSRAARTLQGFLATATDGIIGSGTLEAIDNYPTSVKGVIEVYTAQRSTFYRTLKHYETFGKGWDRRCYETRKTALEMLEVI
jgi:lysozyme family protein